MAARAESAAATAGRQRNGSNTAHAGQCCRSGDPHGSRRLLVHHRALLLERSPGMGDSVGVRGNNRSSCLVRRSIRRLSAGRQRPRSCGSGCWKAYRDSMWNYLLDRIWPDRALRGLAGAPWPGIVDPDCRSNHCRHSFPTHGAHYGCAALLRNWSFQRYRGRGMPADPQLRSAFIVRRICDGRSPLDNFLHFALANTSCGVNVKDMQRAFQRI